MKKTLHLAATGPSPDKASSHTPLISLILGFFFHRYESFKNNRNV